MTTASRPLLILVAGPYRSGTGGDPNLIALNLERLEAAALAIYSAGHIPLIGEWLALPLAKQAGSRKIGDSISESFLYPVAARVLERCDAVYRIPGASQGADEDVRKAKEFNLPVFRRLDHLPRHIR